MTAFDTKVSRTYSQEDIQQILNLAIARQADDINKEFSYEQLLEIAAELDISPESLRLAEYEWLEKQGDIQQRQAFDTYRQTRFKKRFGNYTIANVFLVLFDLVSGGGLSWSLYILLCCGLVLGLDAWNTFQIKGEDYEIAFQRWRRKHQVKQFFNKLINNFLK
jgi:hypothetical protein